MARPAGTEYVTDVYEEGEPMRCPGCGEGEVTLHLVFSGDFTVAENDRDAEQIVYRFEEEVRSWADCTSSCGWLAAARPPETKFNVTNQ